MVVERPRHVHEAKLLRSCIGIRLVCGVLFCSVLRGCIGICGYVLNTGCLIGSGGSAWINNDRRNVDNLVVCTAVNDSHSGIEQEHVAIFCVFVERLIGLTQLVNAISVGANVITGSTATIDFTNFDVASTGGVTFTTVTTEIATGSGEDFNIVPGGAGNVVLGTSNTTGTQLVLDTKTDAGDPTGVNGGMYYNSNSGKFRCFEASAWKDCDTTGSGGGATLLRVTGDVSNSSNPSVFADVTGLTIAVTSGTTYSFTCDMSYTTSATTNALQLSVNGPAATELDYTVLTATSATASHHAAQTAYDTVLNPGTGGGTTRLPVRLQGTVTPSADGTLAVRLRPETAGAAVVVKRGSFCLVNEQ